MPELCPTCESPTVAEDMWVAELVQPWDDAATSLNDFTLNYEGDVK